MTATVTFAGCGQPPDSDRILVTDDGMRVSSITDAGGCYSITLEVPVVRGQDIVYGTLGSQNTDDSYLRVRVSATFTPYPVIDPSTDPSTSPTDNPVTDNSAVPVQVSGLTDVTAIVGDRVNGYALRAVCSPQGSRR